MHLKPYINKSGFYAYKTTNIILAISMAIICLLSPLSFSADLKAGIEYTKGSYRIGPGDVLGISVYHQDDLSQNDILVRDDGFASFKGVGEVAVGGKTVDQVNQLLKARISELVNEPIITITVSQLRSGSVYLAGAVKRPGMLQLASSSSELGNKASLRMDLRLSNVLANAGGVNLNADLSKVEVRQANSSEVICVNLWKMLKEGDRNEDIMIQTGDSVYVPELTNVAMTEDDYDLLLRSTIGPKYFPVRIIGQVGTPGLYELTGDSPYLNSVIAQAGGYKDSANQKLIAIRRFEGANVDTLYVDPSKTDIMLKPNDVVYISDKGIYKAGRFFETVAKVLSPFSSLASTMFSFAWAAGMNK